MDVHNRSHLNLKKGFSGDLRNFTIKVYSYFCKTPYASVFGYAVFSCLILPWFRLKYRKCKSYLILIAPRLSFKLAVSILIPYA